MPLTEEAHRNRDLRPRWMPVWRASAVERRCQRGLTPPRLMDSTPRMRLVASMTASACEVHDYSVPNATAISLTELHSFDTADKIKG